MPETAFLICRFWLIDAWWSIGRREEARELFLDALRHRNRYGLLSEDIHPQTGALWGNFPQTYSMAGLILTAMRSVAQLGGPVLARIVVVSNRVAVPSKDGGARAGGLDGRAALVSASAVMASGSAGAAASSPRARKRCAPIEHAGVTYITTDLSRADYQEYYNGFANRVLWPILHYRLDLAEFSSRDLGGYMRVNESFRRRNCIECCSPTTSSGCTTITCCRWPRRCASAATKTRSASSCTCRFRRRKS